jgi:protein gp37
MGDATGIEWTDATWNPIVGCSIKSPGCTNCYAMAMAARIEKMQPGSHYAGTTQPSKAGPVWTGKLALAPERILTQPLAWRKPRNIFVNSMGDLFHENARDEDIDKAFAVMALTPQHTYQVLTKRAERMAAYLADAHTRIAIATMEAAPINRDISDVGLVFAPHRTPSTYLDRWPLQNVLLGVSVEDERRARERWLPLSDIASYGWRTFVSYEPAIGPVDWSGWQFLSWLISGGESGPHARPSHPDWHRTARDFCAAHGIPYFFKQWGEWEKAVDRGYEDPDWRLDYSRTFADQGEMRWLNLAGGCGFHGERFHVMRRVGKRAAGRQLDGIEHNAMPQTARLL